MRPPPAKHLCLRERLLNLAWCPALGRSDDQKPSGKLDPFAQYQILEMRIVELRRQRDSLGLDPPLDTQAFAIWTAKERRLSSELTELVTQQQIFLQAALKKEEEERRSAERRKNAEEAGAPTLTNLA